jgi:hypothetical protein
MDARQGIGYTLPVEPVVKALQGQQIGKLGRAGVEFENGIWTAGIDLGFRAAAQFRAG